LLGMEAEEKGEEQGEDTDRRVGHRPGSFHMEAKPFLDTGLKLRQLSGEQIVLRLDFRFSRLVAHSPAAALDSEQLPRRGLCTHSGKPQTGITV
jgi:hypothetical protein